VTTIAHLISDASRAKLLARLEELRSLERLMREPGRNRPPDAPPSLADITTRRNMP
jgi:hypothetical protein